MKNTANLLHCCSITVLVALFSLHSIAQTTDASDLGTNAEIKPKLGAGIGIFTFFGDVRDNNFSHAFTSSLGYELLIARNLSPNFDIELKALLGDLSINERSLERNLNFKSSIFNGSANLVYNFNNVYSRPKTMNPFISVGVAYLHFDSKTDLYDANGVQYHYWSDGSIRNLAEDDPLAENAVMIQRDYNFETDLRKLNLDSLGRYSQSAFSIPLSAEVNLRVSPRFNFRLGTTYYFNFTDLIDNVSDAGKGVRKGNSKNDNFLFTSMTFTYNLWRDEAGGSMKDEYYKDQNFDGLFTEDSDSDGVNDFSDQCQGTPEGIAVNQYGCPFDNDNDGIWETDQEKNSAMGAVVNTVGITYNDSMMLAEIADSVAVPRNMIDVIYPSGVLEPNPDNPMLRMKRQAALDELGPVDSDQVEEAPITEKDIESLTQKASQLQNQLLQSQEMDQEFDQISQTIIEHNIQTPEQIDSVFRTADKVYDELAKKSPSGKKKLEIQEFDQPVALIPRKFMDADLNKDGLITADEVLLIIEKFLDGEELFTLPEIYDLVDYFEENMKDARVIDFGGKKGVYINGKLNILPPVTSEPVNPQKTLLAQRFKTADLNKDGTISPDEVNSIIKLYEAGSELYSKEMILELIDLYFGD